MSTREWVERFNPALVGEYEREDTTHSARRSHRAVVTVALNGRRANHYLRLLRRMKRTYIQHTDADLFCFTSLPPGCPPHAVMPYAFKAYAIAEARRRGYTSVLWSDVSVFPGRSLEPLWQLIESQGYWMSNNPPHYCGTWTCDSALPLLGITREEAFGIITLVAGIMGFDFTKPVAEEFMNEFDRLAHNGSFIGNPSNAGGAASADPRVQGHRHDLIAASVIAHRMGLNLTNLGDQWLSEEGEKDLTKSLLNIRRGEDGMDPWN